MKNTLILFLSLIHLTPSFGQVDQGGLKQTNTDSRFYIGIGGGYGFPACQQQIGITSNITSSTETQKNIVGSYGAGINGFFYGGYIISKNLSAEAGVSYLKGNVIDFSETQTGTYSSHYEYKSSAQTARAQIGVRMTCGEKKLTPFLRMAFMVAFNSSMHSGYSGVDNWNLISTTEMIYKGGISCGFNGGAGVSYLLKNNFSVFGEIALVYHNWAPGRSTLTEEIDKGTNTLPSLTTSQLETVYVNNLSYTYPLAVNPSVPRKELKVYYPMSSVGLNIGVEYSFK